MMPPYFCISGGEIALMLAKLGECEGGVGRNGVPDAEVQDPGDHTGGMFAHHTVAAVVIQRSNCFENIKIEEY